MTRKPSAISESFVGSSFAAAGQAQKITELTDRIDELEAEITNLRSRDAADSEKAELESRIQELVSELSARRGIEEVPISAIERNAVQPRQTFPESSIQAIAESLRREGQHTPVILMPLADNKYLLFDGERRWRGASMLGWQTLKAVLLLSDVARDRNSLRRKALSTTLHRENLHPLDLAECLLVEVASSYTHFIGREDEIPRILNTAMSRLERDRRNLELAHIKIADRTTQESWLDGVGLKSPEEREILAVILSLQLNPASIDANIFPMLKLAEDLKVTIREEGLDASKARELDKLSAQKLNLPETEASAIRAEAVRRVIQEKYSVSQVRSLVKKLAVQNSAVGATGSAAPINKLRIKPAKVVEVVRSLEIQKMDRMYLEDLRIALQDKLEEISRALA